MIQMQNLEKTLAQTGKYAVVACPAESINERIPAPEI
jgi:hypothetical protein